MASNDQPSTLSAFKLDQRGLARVFGELEAAVMDAVWVRERATVAEVCEHLGGDAHYKTVMTVMNRLVQKGVLTRRRRSRAFEYRALESRDAFEERVSRRVAEGLVQDFGDVAVAQFVDALDAADPRLLARLAAMVQNRSGSGLEGTGAESEAELVSEPDASVEEAE